MSQIKKINYKKLRFYEDAEILVRMIYKITETFPKTEIYGLKSQLERASTSITSNIAEGCGRGYLLEILRFFRNALASAKEVESQVKLARDLSYITPNTHISLQEILDKVIGRLTNYLKTLQSYEESHI